MRRLASIVRTLMLSGVISLFCTPTFAVKKSLTVRAVTSQSEVRNYNSSYTIPGSPGYSNTNCMGNATGTATTYGNDTNLNINGNTNCMTTTTAPTPAETKDIRISRGFVTNIVEGEGFRYTIQCTANWVGSNCGPLIDGELFPAEIDGNTMWLQARRGGNQGKAVKIKYDIVDSRPVPPVQYSNTGTAPGATPSPYSNLTLEQLRQESEKRQVEIDRRKAELQSQEQPVSSRIEPVGSAPAANQLQAKSQTIPSTAPNQPVAVSIQEQMVAVVFKSTPEGAEITVDGKFMGSTPSTLSLTPGDHAILIQKAGSSAAKIPGGEVTLPSYRTWKRTLTLNPGSTITVDAALEPMR